MKNEEIGDPIFRAAVDSIDCGDVEVLRRLLEYEPSLVTKRLDKPENGYFAQPYLLWFVADNPIRHDKLPSNIVEVAMVILDKLQPLGYEHYQHIINYTLGLVVTGRIPKECGVQIPLMELLVSRGAQIKGKVLGPIGQHNFAAAEWLLAKGSDYDLATAVGLGRLEDVKRLVNGATPSELYVALVVAGFFGKKEMIRLLLDAGADPNGWGEKEDFGGFHSHASALHQAVYSGSLECVTLLVQAGARLDATDKAYSGTPLGWAQYMPSETHDPEQVKRYEAIETYLAGRGKNGRT
jgi:hypothetical protein